MVGPWFFQIKKNTHTITIAPVAVLFFFTAAFAFRFEPRLWCYSESLLSAM